MTPTIDRTRSLRSTRTPEGDGVLEPPGAHALEHGGRLADYRIAYSLRGQPGAPVVAVLGGISAGRRVSGAAPDEGWWNRMVGRGRPLDLRRYRVLSFDYLGGAGGSGYRDPVGRQCRAPEDPEDALGGAPLVTPRDQADALAALLDVLDLGPLHGVVGASYGGAVALALAARHPSRTRGCLVIGAAHRSHPLAPPCARCSGGSSSAASRPGTSLERSRSPGRSR